MRKKKSCALFLSLRYFYPREEEKQRKERGLARLGSGEGDYVIRTDVTWREWILITRNSEFKWKTKQRKTEIIDFPSLPMDRLLIYFRSGFG